MVQLRRICQGRCWLGFRKRLRKTALRALSPLIPPAPYSPGQSPGGEGGPSGIRYWACAVPLFKKRLLTAGVVGEIVAFVQLSVAFVAFA